MERKLAALLSADVQGYSRLMGEDEEATIRTLTAYREVMATLIRQHRGRVVDSPGDNLLAKFASAVDAVRCAVEIQRELKVRNAELPDQRQMEFRMGINVGDVCGRGRKDLRRRGSTSPHDWKGWRSLAASALQELCMTKLRTSWRWDMSTWVNRRSRTSRSRCGCFGCGENLMLLPLR